MQNSQQMGAQSSAPQQGASQPASVQRQGQADKPVQQAGAPITDWASI